MLANNRSSILKSSGGAEAAAAARFRAKIVPPDGLRVFVFARVCVGGCGIVCRGDWTLCVSLAGCAVSSGMSRVRTRSRLCTVSDSCTGLCTVICGGVSRERPSAKLSSSEILAPLTLRAIQCMRSAVWCSFDLKVTAWLSCLAAFSVCSEALFTVIFLGCLFS